MLLGNIQYCDTMRLLHKNTLCWWSITCQRGTLAPRAPPGIGFPSAQDSRKSCGFLSCCWQSPFHSPHPTLVMISKHVVHRVTMWNKWWRNDTTAFIVAAARPLTDNTVAKLTARKGYQQHWSCLSCYETISSLQSLFGTLQQYIWYKVQVSKSVAPSWFDEK